MKFFRENPQNTRCWSTKEIKIVLQKLKQDNLGEKLTWRNVNGYNVLVG